MFRTVFLLVLLLLSTTASADFYGIDRIALGGWSKHVPSSENVTNETHNIFAIEASSWAAGYFKNSYGNDTVFVSKIWRKRAQGHVNFILSLGINYGYTTCLSPDDNSGKNVCPHGYIGIEYDKYFIVPTIKWAPGAFIFSPEIKF